MREEIFIIVLNKIDCYKRQLARLATFFILNALTFATTFKYKQSLFDLCVCSVFWSLYGLLESLFDFANAFD